jgi:hypothetical protein
VSLFDHRNFVFPLGGGGGDTGWGSGYFVTTWRASSADQTITMPASAQTGIPFDGMCRWELLDGTELQPFEPFTGIFDSALEITMTGYPEGTWVRCIISGTFPSIDFYFRPQNRLEIRTVESMGSMGWGDLQDSFRGCAFMTDMSFAGMTLGVVTNIAPYTNAFNGCANLANVDFTGMKVPSNFDVRLNGMFQFCPKLTTLDLSPIDGFEHVTRMNWFVKGCSLVEYIDWGELTFDSMYSADDFEDLAPKLADPAAGNSQSYNEWLRRAAITYELSGGPTGTTFDWSNNKRLTAQAEADYAYLQAPATPMWLITDGGSI